jgi:hypothetical protein
MGTRIQARGEEVSATSGHEQQAAMAEAIARLMAGGVARRIEVEAVEPEPRQDRPPQRDPTLRPPPDAT